MQQRICEHLVLQCKWFYQFTALTLIHQPCCSVFHIFNIPNIINLWKERERSNMLSLTMQQRKLLWNTKRPRFEGVLNISYKCPCFEKSQLSRILAEIDHFRWPNWAETVKRHIYTSSLIIWACNKVSMTFRSRVLASTTPISKNRWFWTFWPNWAKFRCLNLAETVKRNIYTSRPFIEHITKSLWPSVQKF